MDVALSCHPAVRGDAMLALTKMGTYDLLALKGTAVELFMSIVIIHMYKAICWRVSHLCLRQFVMRMCVITSTVM